MDMPELDCVSPEHASMDEYALPAHQVSALPGEDVFVKHTCASLGETYFEARHPSGLRVLVYPKAQSAYYASVGVPYGSMHRKGSEECLGIAHFLEHKMFEMPDGSDADAFFASRGADVNAYTTYDRTTYQFTCTDGFEGSLAALLDLMTDGLHVTEASVAKERSIIAEEIRMDRDNPWDRCYAALLRSLYRHHPIREEICGTEASIQAVTPQRLRRAFAKHYRLSDMVLAVSGPVDPMRVWITVCDALPSASHERDTDGGTPGGTSRCLASFREPTAVNKSRAVLYMPVAKPLFCLGIKDPCVPQNTKGALRRELCMTVLNEMLFSDAGDFYNYLYDSGLVSQGMTYDFTCGQGFGFYELTGEAETPEAVFDAFVTYIQALHARGLSREDFLRSCRLRYADFVTGFDEAEDVAESLLYCALDGLELFDSLREAETITFEEVSALFTQTFQPAQYTLSVVKPLK